MRRFCSAFVEKRCLVRMPWCRAWECGRHHSQAILLAGLRAHYIFVSFALLPLARLDGAWSLGDVQRRMKAPCLHVDLDGAWPRDILPEAEYLDCAQWDAALRYSTTRS